MIFNTQELFSEAQAITGDAPSTNVLDLGATGTVYGAPTAIKADLGKGTPLPILVQAVEDFAGGTSLNVILETDSAEDFSSAKVVAQSGAVVAAILVAGWQFGIQYVPNGVDERYFRIRYDAVGTFTAGAITAGLTMGNQTNG